MFVKNSYVKSDFEKMIQKVKETGDYAEEERNVFQKKL